LPQKSCVSKTLRAGGKRRPAEGEGLLTREDGRAPLPCCFHSARLGSAVPPSLYERRAGFRVFENPRVRHKSKPISPLFWSRSVAWVAAPKNRPEVISNRCAKGGETQRQRQTRHARDTRRAKLKH
jgi:hypothetical protein